VVIVIAEMIPEDTVMLAIYSADVAYAYKAPPLELAQEPVFSAASVQAIFYVFLLLKNMVAYGYTG